MQEYEISAAGAVSPQEPAARLGKAPVDGIFHPGADNIFTCLSEYLNWYRGWHCVENGLVGLLVNSSNLLNGNLAVEEKLIAELEALGLAVAPVFATGSRDAGPTGKDFNGIVAEYFSLNGQLRIDALINLQIFVIGAPSGRDLFEQTVKQLTALNIPVFRPLISYTGSLESWEENHDGLATEIPWSFTTPERQGMIEPVIIACRAQNGNLQPIPERLTKLVRRVRMWVKLKNTPNNGKRLAVFLHNAPCSGVEATLGMGAGLDVFASVIRIFNELKRDGWQIENIPQDGDALHQLLMRRKAYSEFRWTCVAETVEQGGSLYQMPLEGEQGYLRFYERLDSRVRNQMEKTWGPPPGTAMVYDNHLVITGINFGNVILLVQPKRGCYGSKCTGEICKMLHDPDCPPPHQYLATYRYVEEIFQANAVLHVGTQGNLEFLPGKTNALSERCYPDLVLGNVPNFYIYNAGIGSGGMLAKRRTYAVILDHLPSIYRAGATTALQLVNLINDYCEAVSLDSEQVPELENQIRERLAAIPWAGEIVAKKQSFADGLSNLKNFVVQAAAKPKSEKLHVFGSIPGLEDAVWYIKEVIQSDHRLMSSLRNCWPEESVLASLLVEFIGQVILTGEQGDFLRRKLPDDCLYGQLAVDELCREITEIHSRLMLVRSETDNLIKGLKGGYVSPGPAGMPDDNGKNIIPTGRNIYLLDIEKIPTQAAYEVGRKLADELIAAFVAEKGAYPEKIAMNMISLDISRSRGEQLSQVLYLMGVKPVWDRNGKVIDLEIIPLEWLNRPRIDVTLRISGVLRDCYPQSIELIDSAVCRVADLSEPEAVNFVRKHTGQIARELQKQGIKDQLERRATMRIFGDRPGTYGAGVDLALKASAWKDETDLARIFVQFSAYAYGKSLHGNQVMHEFVANVKAADISYDTTNSRSNGPSLSSFGTSVQGGFGLVKKAKNGYELKAYHGSAANPEHVMVTSLRKKIQETLAETLLHPLWREDARQKGYRGAAEIMQRIQNVFAWQCLTREVEDAVLDQLVNLYVNDAKTQAWFNQHNAYAGEEVARRFLELHERGKWQADPETLKGLKASYLQLEGEMEGRLGDVKGDIQAGNIEVVSPEDIKEWQNQLKEVAEVLPGGKLF